jgi:hypothetical protein
MDDNRMEWKENNREIWQIRYMIPHPLISYGDE